MVEKNATANITLSGVNIGTTATLDDFCAFKTADDSTGDVTITLADGTENTLKSVGLCAGLQKNGSGDNIGTLTITGTGTLIATGGVFGAGIGGSGKGAITPTLADKSTPGYRLTIDNPNGYEVSINGVKKTTHDDGKVYAYLPGNKSHTVRVGTSVTV